MKTYKDSELNNMRRAGEILSEAMLAVSKAVAAGVSTLELDSVARSSIEGAGAQCCFSDYRGYGFATCISVNDEVVHGKPRADKILAEGDIVSVDVGVRWGGMCTDAARTFGVGKISDEAQNLIDVTKQCFYEGISGLRAGCLVGDIGRKIECYVRDNTTYSILTDYFGHGIGRTVHEEPLIPNFVPGKNNTRLRTIVRKRLVEQTAICVEPMIAIGSAAVKTKADGWTVVTPDGKWAAHHENTVIVHKDRVEVITDKYI